jgi:hypothetical protein
MAWIEVRADLVEDNWPELRQMPAATSRLGTKLGLLMLWSADIKHVARSMAGETEEAWLLGAFELLVDFRRLLVDGVTGVGLVEWGQPGWLNWSGPHISDDERLLAWLSPAAYRTPAEPRAPAAGQVKETELDSAMLLLGVSKHIAEELAT